MGQGRELCWPAAFAYCTSACTLRITYHARRRIHYELDRVPTNDLHLRHLRRDGRGGLVAALFTALDQVGVVLDANQKRTLSIVLPVALVPAAYALGVALGQFPVTPE